MALLRGGCRAGPPSHGKVGARKQGFERDSARGEGGRRSLAAVDQAQHARDLAALRLDGGEGFERRAARS